jgi:hypothetical protein
MYRKDKLERVISFYRAYNQIYYHNNFITINDKNREIKILEDYIKIPPYASFNLPEYSFTVQDTRETNIRDLLKLNVNFNSSSICVKREVLENVSNYLKKIKAVIDSFIFYSSLLIEGNILLDPARLTYYRIHSFQSSSGNISNIMTYRQSLSDVLKKAIDDFYIINEMVNGKLDITEEELLRYKLLYKIFSGKDTSLKVKFNFRLIKYYLLSLLPSFLKYLYIRDQYEKRKKVKYYNTSI